MKGAGSDIDDADEATERTLARLRRHVPEVALSWLVDEPGRRWRAVDGTLCFADVSGFTALSERLESRGRRGAEELVDTLNRVFGAILDVAAGRGGELLKFGGDALLFLFHGPGHAPRAAATAASMHRELRRAASEVTAFGRLKLSMSIGVASGPIDLFLVGAPHRELVISGPVLDETIEAEGLAVGGETLLSPSTAAGLPAGAWLAAANGRFARLLWQRPPAAVTPGHRGDRAPADLETVRALLPTPLVNALGAEVEPGHRSASIAFIRLSGADAALARGPEVLAAALDATLRVVQSALEEEGLTLLAVDVDRDGAKCFCAAGAPAGTEDDEGRMLRALRRIVTAEVPLRVQAGVNRGHVFAAEIGSAGRAAYSAMGDTTNTAARIAAKAPTGKVYAHPAVLERARTLYDSEPAGPFTFKGKSEPLVVYDVGAAIGPRDEPAQHRLPMLGRETEAAAVTAAVERVRAGTGGALTVIGAAGLGKTRLARETINSAGLPMIVARAEPYGLANAYRPWRDPIRRLLDIERGSNADMAAALWAAVERLAPDLCSLAPLLGDVTHVEMAPTPEVEAIASRHRPDRIADVVIDMIARVHEGPLIIGAEDAQWVDEASAHLFGRIAAVTPERPWLLFVVRRDGGGGFVPLDGEVVELRPLPDQTVRALAIAATEATPLRPHEIARVVDQAAGSPQYVEEWAQAAQVVGSLDAVPDSINAVVSAQVDALSPLSRRVLGVAAVLGRSFRREVLATVLAAEGRELDEPTEEELERLLEVDGETRLRFRNGLVRDVVYEGLAYRTRARIHQLAGEMIERTSNDVSGDVEVLAEHFGRAGDVERTWRYSLAAADRARNVYANADAAQHLERALDVAARLPLTPAEVLARWVELGNVRARAGHFAEALDAYARAADFLPPDPVARAELLLRRARVHERAGAYATALRTTSRARTLVNGLVGTASASVRAEALAFSALVRQRQERAALAWRAAEEAFQAGQAASSRSAQARASNVMSWAAMVLGRPEAIELAERSLQLYEEIGDADGQADLANNLGIMAYFDGRWDETLERYEQSRRACERVGNLLDAASTEANIGEVLVNQHRLDEAVPVLQDASRVLRSSGHRWGAAFAEMHLGRVAMLAGDADRAVAMLTSTRDEFAAMGRAASVYETSIHLADALTRAGRGAEALVVLESSAGSTSDEVAIFDAARARVQSAALLGVADVEEARRVLEQGIAVARERRLGFELGLMLADADSFPGEVDIGSHEPPADESARLLTELGVISLSTAT